jgi:hypothetical protein
MDRVCQSLNHFEQRQRFIAMNNSAFPAQVYTGCCRKPSYDIHEGHACKQKNFGAANEVIWHECVMKESYAQPARPTQWLCNTVYVKPKSTKPRETDVMHTCRSIPIEITTSWFGGLVQSRNQSLQSSVEARWGSGKHLRKSGSDWLFSSANYYSNWGSILKWFKHRL